MSRALRSDVLFRGLHHFKCTIFNGEISMKIKGVIPPEELTEDVMIIQSDEASVVAYDPEAQEIVGKYLLGKSNVFAMHVNVPPDRLKRVIFLWQCANDTVMRQVHPKISLISDRD